MIRKRDLDKMFKPLMKAYGFEHHFCFVRIQNDLAFCFLFDGGSFVYPTFYLVPLYFPPQYIGLTYGNRLRGLTLFRDWNEEQLEQWRKMIEEKLIHELFPQMEAISSPEKLIRYMEAHDGLPEFIWTSKMFESELRLYTYYYLRENAKIEKEKEIFQRLIEESTYFDSFKQDHLQKVRELDKAYRAGGIDQYIENNKKRILENEFKITVDK